VVVTISPGCLSLCSSLIEFDLGVNRFLLCLFVADELEHELELLAHDSLYEDAAELDELADDDDDDGHEDLVDDPADDAPTMNVLLFVMICGGLFAQLAIF
jgi:hypothetical protein